MKSVENTFVCSIEGRYLAVLLAGGSLETGESLLSSLSLTGDWRVSPLLSLTAASYSCALQRRVTRCLGLSMTVQILSFHILNTKH